MASPQVEHGYTKIANELLDAILAFGFSKRQITVLLAIVRKTYGFNKSEDDMTVQQLADLTQIPRQHVSTTLGELIQINAVLKRDGQHGYLLKIQKNYGSWHRPKTGHVPKQDGDRPKTGHLMSQNRTHKRQLQKTTPKENDHFDLFWDKWPRKVAKAGAQKAWAKLAPDEGLAQTIVEAVSAQSRQWDNPKFIPHPATWLNGKRWEDEAPNLAGGANRHGLPLWSEVQ